MAAQLRRHASPARTKARRASDRPRPRKQRAPRAPSAPRPSPESAPPAQAPPPPYTDPILRAGMVAFVGRTNVGKSSLVNALVGAKVSIVTPKPQTTRHPVHGVVHHVGTQIVIVDTPGFFRTRKSRLVDRLHERSRNALQGIDAVVHVVDPSRPIGTEDEMAIEALANVTQPVLLCLNKSDLRHRPHREDWLTRAGRYAVVVEVSAHARTGFDALLTAIAARLPQGPALYGPGEITNVHRDFRIAEIIREKVYLMTDAEVPYRTAIELDLVEDRTSREGRPLIQVKAAILVGAERYKGMLIGAGGCRIRDIGIAARRDLEPLLGRQVFLDLAVIVDPDLDP